VAPLVPEPRGHRTLRCFCPVSGPGRSSEGFAGQSTRLVVTGSECTGKTTLSQQLAERLGALWVPEYARIYAESVGRPLIAADVSLIARGQVELEDAGLASLPSLVVQDTDLISTVVYARHYYGGCPDWVFGAALERRASFYLLCDIDIPWIADKVRDRPLERQELDTSFRVTLAEFGAVVAPVSDLGDDRLRVALDAVRAWQSAR